MGVRIDKTRAYNRSECVDHFICIEVTSNAVGATNADELPVGDGDRGLVDHPHIAHIAASFRAARCRARYQLSNVFDYNIRLHVWVVGEMISRRTAVLSTQAPEVVLH